MRGGYTRGIRCRGHNTSADFVEVPLRNRHRLSVGVQPGFTIELFRVRVYYFLTPALSCGTTANCCREIAEGRIRER